MLGNSLPRMSSFFITPVTMKILLGLGVELVLALHIVQNIVLRFPFMKNATLKQKKRVLLIGLQAIDDPGWFPYHKILVHSIELYQGKIQKKNFHIIKQKASYNIEYWNHCLNHCFFNMSFHFLLSAVFK